MDIGISREHRPRLEHDVYQKSDVFSFDDAEGEGIHLVLNQHLNRLEPNEWHLHQDLVLGLGLMKWTPFSGPPPK
jgi:hypothetical protein